MVILVDGDRRVTGSLSLVFQGTDALGQNKVTQTGGFAGSIDDTNQIIASGSYRSLLVLANGVERSSNHDLVVRASPKSDDLMTWEVTAGEQGGPMTAFEGCTR